ITTRSSVLNEPGIEGTPVKTLVFLPRFFLSSAVPFFTLGPSFLSPPPAPGLSTQPSPPSSPPPPPPPPPPPVSLGDGDGLSVGRRSGIVGVDNWAPASGANTRPAGRGSSSAPARNTTTAKEIRAAFLNPP